jgi:hypothetical protein
MSDLSYRQAMMGAARSYLAEFVPDQYSQEMTEEAVVHLVEEVVEQMEGVWRLVDQLRLMGLLADAP